MSFRTRVRRAVRRSGVAAAWFMAAGFLASLAFRPAGWAIPIGCFWLMATPCSWRHVNRDRRLWRRRQLALLLLGVLDSTAMLLPR